MSIRIFNEAVYGVSLKVIYPAGSQHSAVPPPAAAILPVSNSCPPSLALRSCRRVEN